MYRIKSLKTNTTCLGKLLPNIEFPSVNLKDFFDKGNLTEQEILKVLQNRKDIEVIIEEKNTEVEKKEEIDFENMTKKELANKIKELNGKVLNIDKHKKEELIEMYKKALEDKK